MTNPVQQAVDSVGSQSELRRLINEQVSEPARRLSLQAVNKWVRNQRIPADRVLVVEQVTGISRHVLRPDIYGPKDAAA